MNSERSAYDVVVVGGGHNGLVAATYLARAGLSTLVLERLDHPGGAAASYPVTRLLERLAADLGLDLRPASRPVASYAPTLRDGKPGGLLVQRPAKRKTEKSFRELTGSDSAYDAWVRFQGDAGRLADVVAPTLLGPLPLERTIRDQVDPQVWSDFVTRPIGETIEARFSDDTVRGVAAGDALIGTFASLHDTSLVQNRSFLHHLIGSGTGESQVPADALAAAATAAGAELVTSAGVSAIEASPDGAEVTWDDASGSHRVQTRYVLANVAPWVLDILLGQAEDSAAKPEGAQVAITLHLDRLPRLRSGLDPEVAFAGILRLGADHSRLSAAYDDAAAGRVPSEMSGSITTSLGDSPTLTYVGLHTPASLFDEDPEGAQQLAVARALAELDRHLVDPIESCLALGADGRPRLEVRIPQDLERDLAMPGGHLFHGDLEWPWAPNRARLDTPAQQWGVQTDLTSVLICGSGSRRGGVVSGLGGHNAAHAVLASL